MILEPLIKTLLMILSRAVLRGPTTPTVLTTLSALFVRIPRLIPINGGLPGSGVEQQILITGDALMSLVPIVGPVLVVTGVILVVGVVTTAGVGALQRCARSTRLLLESTLKPISLSLLTRVTRACTPLTLTTPTTFRIKPEKQRNETPLKQPSTTFRPVVTSN